MKMQNIVVNHHGRNISGKLYLPDKEKFPTVIFSHGFNGIGDDFSEYAKVLLENGFGACTYDFCGGSLRSKSDLTTVEMTVFTEKEDLIAMMDAVKKTPCVDSGNVFLFGASMGGLVSALAAEERKNSIKGLMLLYPALCVADNWNEAFPDIRDIPAIHKLWEVPLGKCFFESLHGFNIFENIGNYSKNVLILHGDKDEIVPVQYSEKANALYPHSSLEIFPGEGHGFSDSGTKKVINSILDFVRTNS